MPGCGWLDGVPAGRTVRSSFSEAGQPFEVILPSESVSGAGTALPWIVLACGLVLGGLAAALGVNAARRARAQDGLDRIFTLSPDLVAVADFDGHFTRVNPAAEKILGRPKQELLERPYLEFVHPDDRATTAAQAAALAEGSTTRTFENRFIRVDGSARVLEWTAAAEVADEGFVFGVARDVDRASTGRSASWNGSPASSRRCGGWPRSWRRASHRRRCSPPSTTRWSSCWAPRRP